MVAKTLARGLSLKEDTQRKAEMDADAHFHEVILHAVEAGE